ncbi:MAG: Rieske 2Fe-2S domain-containing protein [Candidatus Eremiobacteraeota bacterium]|nr:Rieske 2Fe-2S domain-containing protein [Candidatus Eremiobacteraeota bacterium]
MPIAQQLVDLALQTPGLDAAGDALAGAVNGALDAAGAARQPLKDALNGTWLGHSLHPAITDVPIGAWTAALALDLLGEPRGARIAVGVGLLGALGAAATGLTDLTDTYGKPRRLGVVHAALNGAATLLYGASWLARGKGRGGVFLSTLGYGAVSLSALYGGTLSLDLQIGVNKTSATDPPEGEVDVAALTDVPDGGMKRVDAGGYPVLLVRRGGEIHAIAALCTHRGAPLDEGTLDGDVVTCPWHGSKFCVLDGGIIAGPAAYPQPAFSARVLDGRVRITAEGPH